MVFAGIQSMIYLCSSIYLFPFLVSTYHCKSMIYIKSKKFMSTKDYFKCLVKTIICIFNVFLLVFLIINNLFEFSTHTHIFNRFLIIETPILNSGFLIYKYKLKSVWYDKFINTHLRLKITTTPYEFLKLNNY